MKLSDLSDDDIRALKYYYEVELRQNCFTQGSRYINLIPTRKLMERIDFNGLRTLDVGIMEGAISVLLARAGADLTCYDRLDLSDRVNLVKQAYGCVFDYQSGMPFHHFAMAEKKKENYAYNAVVFSGVLYHAIDPLLFLILPKNSTSSWRHTGLRIGDGHRRRCMSVF